MAAKKKAGGLSLKNQFELQKVPEYLDTLRQKKDQLVGEAKEEVATDGDLQGHLEGFSTNITSTNDVKVLIRMAGAIKDRERIYNDGLEALGLDLEDHPFKIGKWSAETWLNDIKRQLKLVTHKDELAKIDKAIAIVEKYQSEDQEFNNDMRQLADLLDVNK